MNDIDIADIEKDLLYVLVCRSRTDFVSCNHV